MYENRLKILKNEKNLKSMELAKKFNIAPSTYSEWEHNKIPIPTIRLIEIANYFEINIDYLLKLTNQRIKIKTTNQPNLKEIGKRIKQIRNDLNLSLRAMGEKLNSSYTALGSYERGEKLIQSETLLAIAQINNNSIDYILNRSKEKELSKTPNQYQYTS